MAFKQHSLSASQPLSRHTDSTRLSRLLACRYCSVLHLIMQRLVTGLRYLTASRQHRSQQLVNGGRVMPPASTDVGTGSICSLPESEALDIAAP